MAQTSINIRMDDTLKKQFEVLCSELGLSMSTAFTLFAKTMVRQQGLPFELTLRTPNQETLAAIQDVDQRRNLSGPYSSIASLKESLDA
ncbi:MAG: type II toxin-antitoxin system RelB/DinJ family antitoxin [Ruminiclostridium sp.]|nr:type II toxin-antitoxin system RelB/DinJ family antitoxin [Ruminiclostridium sp.]